MTKNNGLEKILGRYASFLRGIYSNPSGVVIPDKWPEPLSYEETTESIKQLILESLPSKRETKFNGQVEGMYYVETWKETLERAKANAGWNAALDAIRQEIEEL